MCSSDLKEKLVGFYGKKSELKELEKEVSVLEECIKTLDNWKVRDNKRWKKA